MPAPRNGSEDAGRAPHEWEARTRLPAPASLTRRTGRGQPAQAQPLRPSSAAPAAQAQAAQPQQRRPRQRSPSSAGPGSRRGQPGTDQRRRGQPGTDQRRRGQPAQARRPGGGRAWLAGCWRQINYRLIAYPVLERHRRRGPLLSCVTVPIRYRGDSSTCRFLGTVSLAGGFGADRFVTGQIRCRPDSLQFRLATGRIRYRRIRHWPIRHWPIRHWPNPASLRPGQARRRARAGRAPSALSRSGRDSP